MSRRFSLEFQVDSPWDLMHIYHEISWRFPLQSNIDYPWNLEDILHEISWRFPFESGGDFHWIFMEISPLNLVKIIPGIPWRLSLEFRGYYIPWSFVSIIFVEFLSEISRRFLLESGGDFPWNVMEIPLRSWEDSL